MMALSLYEQLLAIDKAGNNNQLVSAYLDTGDTFSTVQSAFGRTTAYSYVARNNYYLVTEIKLLTYDTYSSVNGTTFIGHSQYQWNIYGGGVPTGTNAITLKGAFFKSLDNYDSDASSDFTEQTLYPGAEEKLLWSGTAEGWNSFDQNEGYIGTLPVRFGIFESFTPPTGEQSQWLDAEDFQIMTSACLPCGTFPSSVILDKWDKEITHIQPTTIDYIIKDSDKTIDRVHLLFRYGTYPDYVTVERDVTGITSGRHSFTLPALSETQENFDTAINTLFGSDRYTTNLYCKVVVYYTDGTSSTSDPSQAYNSNSGSTTIVNLADSAPLLTYSVVDTNSVSVALSGDEKTLIRHISKAKVTMVPEARLGATITKFWFEHGGFTYENYEELAFEETVLTNDFVFYVTDSRNQTIKIVYEAPFVEYTPPTCNFRSNRPTGEGGVNIGAYGNCWLGNFGAAQNTITVEYHFTPANMNAWTTWHEYEELTTTGTTYTASHSLSGLSYQANYKFEAKITDLYTTVISVVQFVGSRPIFDWSTSDFNFNIPVNAAKGITINGENVVGREAENRVLWSGSDVMLANATAELSELVSTQPNGIILIFSGLDRDSSWSTHFVPKIMVQINNGGGQTFMTPINAEVSQFGFKYLYIFDDRIEGHASNASTGGAASGVWFNNDQYVLRYVIGV